MEGWLRRNRHKEEFVWAIKRQVEGWLRRNKHKEVFVWASEKQALGTISPLTGRGSLFTRALHTVRDTSPSAHATSSHHFRHGLAIQVRIIVDPFPTELVQRQRLAIVSYMELHGGERQLYFPVKSSGACARCQTMSGCCPASQSMQPFMPPHRMGEPVY